MELHSIDVGQKSESSISVQPWPEYPEDFSKCPSQIPHSLLLVLECECTYLCRVVKSFKRGINDWYCDSGSREDPNFNI